MTEPSYRGAPSLDDYFRDAIREGMSPDKAARSLESRIRKKLLATEPELVWPFDLIPTGDGHLYVKMTNGEGSARNFLISVEHDRGMTTIFGINPPTAHEQAAIDSMYPDLVPRVREPDVPAPTPEPVTAPEPAPPVTAPGITPPEPMPSEPTPPTPNDRQARRLRELMTLLKSDNEARAVEWQAPRLNENSKVDDDKQECMRRFNISERGHEERVLPAARVKAGLPERSVSGPKAARPRSKRRPKK